MDIVYHAMRLAADVYGLSEEDIDKYFGKVILDFHDRTLTQEQKREKSINLLFDDTYLEYKDRIVSEVYGGLDNLLEGSRARRSAAYDRVEELMNRKRALVILMLLAFLITFITTLIYMILPISSSVGYIRDNKKLPLKGAAEYVYLADAYNHMLDENMRNQNELAYEASHDSLTGLYNRKVFDEKRMEFSAGDAALILVDVDHFKTFNDTYGHEVGDRVLKKSFCCSYCILPYGGLRVQDRRRRIRCNHDAGGSVTETCRP